MLQRINQLEQGQKATQQIIAFIYTFVRNNASSSSIDLKGFYQKVGQMIRYFVEGRSKRDAIIQALYKSVKQAEKKQQQRRIFIKSQSSFPEYQKMFETIQRQELMQAFKAFKLYKQALQRLTQKYDRLTVQYSQLISRNRQLQIFEAIHNGSPSKNLKQQEMLQQAKGIFQRKTEKKLPQVQKLALKRNLFRCPQCSLQQSGNIQTQLADDIYTIAESASQIRQLINHLLRKSQKANIQMAQRCEQFKRKTKEEVTARVTQEVTAGVTQQIQRDNIQFLQSQQTQFMQLRERLEERYNQIFNQQELAISRERSQKQRFETEINMLADRCQQLTQQLRQSEERFEEFERKTNAELDHFESRQKGLLDQIRKLNENLQIERQINRYRTLAHYVPEYL